MNALTAQPFESALLQEIASAVEHRSKAIRYHGDLKCSRAVNDSIECLNVAFTTLIRFRLRLCCWPDGVLWLSVTKPGPRRTGGWAYCDEVHSHVGGLEVLNVVERIEKTIHTPTQARNFWPASQDEARPALDFNEADSH
jgi:hypothetical protein